MVTNKHVTCHEHLLLIFGEYHQLLMGNPTIYSYEQIWLEVKPAMAISHAIWFVYGHPFHNQNPNTWVYMKIDMCIYILWVYKSLLTLLSLTENTAPPKPLRFIIHYHSIFPAAIT